MAQISAKDLIPNSFTMSREDIAGQLGMVWELIKAPLIVPVLRLSVYVCLAMALMLFMERVYMGIVIVLVKLFWQKPAKRYNWQPIEEDLESGSSNFPIVLVQIPMYNEKEVTPPLDLAVTTALLLLRTGGGSCVLCVKCSNRCTRSRSERRAGCPGRRTAS